MGCEEKRYAIREVSELTGVKPVTLRAWQRRYNIIQPLRTEKGHRLYTSSTSNRLKPSKGGWKKGSRLAKSKRYLKVIASWLMTTSTTMNSYLKLS